MTNSHICLVRKYLYSWFAGRFCTKCKYTTLKRSSRFVALSADVQRTRRSVGWSVGQVGFRGKFQTLVSCTNMYPSRNRKALRRPEWEMMNLDGMYKHQFVRGMFLSGWNGCCVFFFCKGLHVWLFNYKSRMLGNPCWQSSATRYLSWLGWWTDEFCSHVLAKAHTRMNGEKVTSEEFLLTWEMFVLKQPGNNNLISFAACRKRIARSWARFSANAEVPSYPSRIPRRFEHRAGSGSILTKITK